MYEKSSDSGNIPEEYKMWTLDAVIEDYGDYDYWFTKDPLKIGFQIEWSAWWGWKIKRWVVNFWSGETTINIGFAPKIIMAYVYTSNGISIWSADISSNGIISQSCISSFRNHTWEVFEPWFDMSYRLFRVHDMLWDLKTVNTNWFMFSSTQGGTMTYVCYG